MYNKHLSPPTGGDPLRQYQQQQQQQQQPQEQQQHFVEEHTADSAAEEAVAWSSLCDQFTRNLLKLELQTTETRYRSELVEEESALRVFIYNSLLFGITSHSARLSGQFCDLMENVRSLQNNHDRLLQEKQTHAHAIAEYHAQQILEQRSHAEVQAMNYQHRIENLREDERDLRVRVENLRREAEESQTNLDRRRNDSLEERRVLENELQRLQNEVGNQKYLLDRLNAQVDSSKQKLRQTERMTIERSVSGGGIISAGNYDNYNVSTTNSMYQQQPTPAAATPLSALQQQQHNTSGYGYGTNININNNGNNQQLQSASPDRHGDSIATGLSHIQAIRDGGVDEQFLRTGRVTPVRIPPQFYSSINNNNNSTSSQLQNASSLSRTPIFNPSAASTSTQQTANATTLITNHPSHAGLSATAQRSLSSVYQSQLHQTYSPAAAMSASSRQPPGSATTNTVAAVNGGLFDSSNRKMNGIGGGGGSGSSKQGEPSQWQMRLMKLQGELKSLKNDLGVASPPSRN